MKILVVHGSPKKENSNTNKILMPFLEGAKEEGADYDLVYLQERRIKPCLGCLNCWFKTPGECIQKDDMSNLLDMMRNADILVCATPLYYCGMSTQLKNFFDRTFPFISPFFEKEDGHWIHPARYKYILTEKMALISNCGSHETFHFDELVSHMEAIARIANSEFIGALLRPHGTTLEIAEQLMPEKTKAVYQAAKEAGRQVARGEGISEEISQEVSRELMGPDDFANGANEFIKRELKKIGR